MFDAGPFTPARCEGVEAALAEAIRSFAGGQMTRNAEVFLAGICAKHLTDKLALAGFGHASHRFDGHPDGNR
jgi:hypothetical protein